MVLQRVNPKVVSRRRGHAGNAITSDTYSLVSRTMQADPQRRWPTSSSATLARSG
jgi:hypothetical protein